MHCMFFDYHNLDISNECEYEKGIVCFEQGFRVSMCVCVMFLCFCLYVYMLAFYDEYTLCMEILRKLPGQCLFIFFAFSYPLG